MVTDATPVAPTKVAKRRLDHVDAMRPIKQAGVVSTHSLLAFAPATALAVGAALMLLHVTRESFLFVSACMLTYSYYGLQRNAYGHFYRRRFVSVCVPYFCWTVIYFFLTLPSFSFTFTQAVAHFGYLLVTGYYQLYYLLVIMQFYILFPLALKLLRKTAGHHVAVLIASGALQVLLTILMHWNVLPPHMRGFWATREITSYQFYLLAGMIAALHLDELHEWLIRHTWVVLGATFAAAIVAEAWYVAAVHHLAGWLGSSSDPLQPIVIPFNMGAIACLYLLGVYLVDPKRSHRTKAMVRSGSDNAYGVYLSQMVFILSLGWLGWRSLDHVMPWLIVTIVSVVVIFLACVLLTSILARTPLAVALTGRQQQSWATWWPESFRPARRTGRGAPDPVVHSHGEDVVSSPLDIDEESEEPLAAGSNGAVRGSWSDERGLPHVGATSGSG